MAYYLFFSLFYLLSIILYHFQFQKMLDFCAKFAQHKNEHYEQKKDIKAIYKAYQ